MSPEFEDFSLTTLDVFETVFIDFKVDDSSVALEDGFAGLKWAIF